jgi:hypothetical protein
MNTYLTKLSTDSWRTSSARYNAARRLRRREVFATVSLALLSSLTVACAFVQRVYAPSGSAADNYLTVVSASLGVFLLTISLVEWGARTGAVADSLHRNAEKLNAFNRRLGLQIASVTSITMPAAQTLFDEYEAIKADCAHNHEPIDDAFFRSKHLSAPEFLNANGQPDLSESQAFWIACMWHVSSVWYFALLWIMILGLLAYPLVSGVSWSAQVGEVQQQAAPNIVLQVK